MLIIVGFLENKKYKNGTDIQNDPPATFFLSGVHFLILVLVPGDLSSASDRAVQAGHKLGLFSGCK